MSCPSPHAFVLPKMFPHRPTAQGEAQAKLTSGGGVPFPKSPGLGQWGKDRAAPILGRAISRCFHIRSTEQTEVAKLSLLRFPLSPTKKKKQHNSTHLP